ncbi:DUF2935 domain-containing protein [Peribacillus cavernae]|uniref:DUF2935 domain-containing protein n=1 Tax=Peribacillus cavernae TaxID=1674310 RepID=A0A433HJ17_9BACI|nr:DUF2935 domain-containing protein [Peribacillus cavernae]MDQ0217797.1 hypothetical protein [Peribacillus cavernae]RUQ28249.1 DUF2935 domain-containing protein [Peribacillus cavernae]
MTFERDALFEHSFWLQVLGDHSRFILETLVASEVEDIKKAEYFKENFDSLLNGLPSLTENQLIPFTRNVKELVMSFREFKLSLLRKILTGGIKMQMSPTFISHMVNELEEYVTIICFLEKGEKPPVFHELHHHLLWLVDAAGHAGTINDKMDSVEKDLKCKSAAFMKKFEDFYLRAVELTGYLRTNLHKFPALEKMNKDVKLEIRLFRIFLEELEEMELSEQALGTFSALMADHMLREECYYLMKVAESTQTEPPDCNPAKRRIEK